MGSPASGNPADGETFIEVPAVPPDHISERGDPNQPRSTIGPMGESMLGRGWYATGAGKRGPQIKARQLMAALALVAAGVFLARLLG